MPYILRIPDELITLIRGLHPQLKKKIRAALIEIIKDPFSGKALKEELKGLWIFRITRIRIVCLITGKKFIDIVTVGPRQTIYVETYKLLKRKK